MSTTVFSLDSAQERIRCHCVLQQLVIGHATRTLKEHLPTTQVKSSRGATRFQQLYILMLASKPTNASILVFTKFQKDRGINPLNTHLS